MDSQTEPLKTIEDQGKSIWRGQERDDGSVVENSRFYTKITDFEIDLLSKIKTFYGK